MKFFLFALFLAIGASCISAHHHVQNFGNTTGTPIRTHFLFAPAVPNQVQTRWFQFQSVNYAQITWKYIHLQEIFLIYSKHPSGVFVMWTHLVPQALEQSLAAESDKIDWISQLHPVWEMESIRVCCSSTEFTIELFSQCIERLRCICRFRCTRNILLGD